MQDERVESQLGDFGGNEFTKKAKDEQRMCQDDKAWSERAPVATYELLFKRKVVYTYIKG